MSKNLLLWEKYRPKTIDDTILLPRIKSHFENANWKGRFLEGEKSNFYRNYFLGTDESRWKTEVKSVKQTVLVDFYEGIDLILDGSGDKLKYSFLVKPNIDPAVILKSIRGSNAVSLKDEALHIATDFGEIIEEKPTSIDISFYHPERFNN